jgi:phosphoribosylformylglycinamidine (FGAM) synthase-like amidotransferase family enzyme
VLVLVCVCSYGDMYPTSDGGRAAATVLIFLSVLILALPISVIGNNFSRGVESYNNEKRDRKEAKTLLLRKLNQGIVAKQSESVAASGGSSSSPNSDAVPKSLNHKTIHNRLMAKFEEYDKQLTICNALKSDIHALLIQHGNSLDAADVHSPHSHHHEILTLADSSEYFLKGNNDDDATSVVVADDSSKNPMLKFDIVKL